MNRSRRTSSRLEVSAKLSLGGDAGCGSVVPVAVDWDTPPKITRSKATAFLSVKTSARKRFGMCSKTCCGVRAFRTAASIPAASGSSASCPSSAGSEAMRDAVLWLR